MRHDARLARRGDARGGRRGEVLSARRGATGPKQSDRPSDPPIRAAREADAAAIAGLAEQLGYPSTTMEIVERLAALDRGGRVLVAEEEGRVIGWVHVFGAFALESPPRAEIGGLVVDETYRRRGVGARLMRAAEDWAASAGYATVRLRSNVIREEAHRFYERLGYARTKTQLVFAKTIDLARRRSTQRL